MRKKAFTLITGSLLYVLSLSAQCVDRDSLSKQLSLSGGSSSRLPADQLKVLLGFELRLRNCSYKNDSLHCTLLRRIGKLYFYQSDFLNAVQYYRQAIEIIIANAGKPSVNRKDLVGAYYWLSIMYDSLNMVAEKLVALDNCADVAIQLKSIDRACLSALYQRVEYFYDVGDYHRCISYASQCEALGREYANSGTDLAYADGTHYALSSLLWNVNALLQLKNYEAAEKLLINKVEEFKKVRFNDNLGVIYDQLAKVQLQKGNYKRALSYFHQSLANEQKLGHDINCKSLLNNIGYEVYFKYFKDEKKALDYYKKALAYPINKADVKNISNLSESLNILNRIANIYVRKGFFDSAFIYFQLAFDQVEPGTTETKILNASLDEFARQKKIEYLAGLLIDKGDAFQKQYQANRQISTIREAVRIYKLADRLLDRIKAGQSDLKSKLFWRNDSRRLYEQAIEACYSYGDIENAVYFFEKSRAVLLNDQLKEQHWMNEDNIHKQVQLKKRILRDEMKLNGLNDTAEECKKLRNDLFANNKELDRLNNIIKTGNPLYYQSFLDTNIITLKDVREKILSDHNALIEFFAGDSAAYTLIITTLHAKLVKINKPSFDSLSALFIAYNSDPSLLNRNFNTFIKLSRNLYQLIFQDSPIPAGRIIISPDGQYFPFEALVCSNSGESPVYFLEDHAVSYTYSARYLLNKFVSSSDINPHNFMGNAPVQYPQSMNLSALNGSDRSLRLLQSYFNDDYGLLLEKASKANFLSQFSKYKVIQLYTHASGSSINGEPVIYFADSALYLSELLEENIPATSLIVLSACETGSGKWYQGEGVFGFNRGFASVGIPSSITNLWSVDNASTYRITELFYKYLAKGLQLDIALQLAKKEFIKTGTRENELPYYWAGAILAGKTDSIDLVKGFNWKYTFIGILLAVLVVVGLLFWRKNKIRVTYVRRTSENAM